jgi:hypothetical protein
VPEPAPDAEALDAARERRVELKHAMSGLELAAAGAAGDATWIDGLRAALDEMEEALSAHVEEVEADDGLLSELVTDAPRLASRVQRLRDEHPQLADQVRGCRAMLDDPDPHEIRQGILDLLVALAHHRHFGADLVYEAYHVDIGGQS